MLRSDEMECVSLYFGADGVRNVLERLGESKLIHFIGDDSRNLKYESAHIEKFEQKLQFLRKELESRNKAVKEHAGIPNVHILEIENEVLKTYERLSFLKSSNKINHREEEVFAENLKMIRIGRKFVGDARGRHNGVTVNFDFITMIADTDKKVMIKQMLFHRLRRNVYIRTTDIESTGKQQTVFVVYIIGETNKEFARKIIRTLGARIFDYSTRDIESHQALERRYSRLRRLNRTIERQISEALEEVSAKISIWEYCINKEKAILGAMKKLVKIDQAQCYTGEGWVQRKSIPELEKMKCSDNEQGRFFFEAKKTNLERPTSFELSEFARAFQELTNVFGVPKYQELNPAIFMMFTFPFLFGAMFGDVLHGLILGAAAVYLIFNYEKLDRKCGIFQIVLNGRYVVLACSFFAVWFGFLYGDFGSLPLALFRSQYDVGRTYPFGIDPIWHHADNKMVFVNSLKMKLSLIIGFFHMGLGSAISISNSIYFGDQLTLICQAIPQAIAFVLFLGYVVFLCLYKWIVTIDHPSIVNTLIAMYTDPFNVKNQIYPGQMMVQLLIFSTILICIPWMMFTKPLYLTFRRRIPEAGVLDLWITSGIHVVEFCLGLISNTSSYLRLWAVSLAHVQLTSVLHEFTLGSKSILVKLITLPIYVSGTLLLLIGLEGLSSCLHALRLNWIEFFSKFYAGGGVEFSPLNFKVPESDS